MAETLLPEAKVAYVPGATFFPVQQEPNHARLSFSGVPDDRLVHGITELGGLLEAKVQPRWSTSAGVARPSIAGERSGGPVTRWAVEPSRGRLKPDLQSVGGLHEDQLGAEIDRVGPQTAGLDLEPAVVSDGHRGACPLLISAANLQPLTTFVHGECPTAAVVIGHGYGLDSEHPIPRRRPNRPGRAGSRTGRASGGQPVRQPLVGGGRAGSPKAGRTGSRGRPGWPACPRCLRWWR